MNDFIRILETCILKNDFELKPTQDKLSIPLIFRIYKKMSAKFEFDAIKTCDGLIVDGHHRFIASVLADVKIEQFPSTRNSNQITFEWKDIILKANEYDSTSEIKYHNFNDAKRNGKTIDEVEKILID